MYAYPIAQNPTLFLGFAPTAKGLFQSLCFCSFLFSLKRLKERPDFAKKLFKTLFLRPQIIKLRAMNPSPTDAVVILADEAQTEAIAQKFASAFVALREHILKQGFNLRLTGDLGAGKTTFTRALLRSLGVTGRVRSPTFELVEEYDVLEGCVFYHFDFYRFESPREFAEAGFRDMFGSARITACEWSEKAADYLPAADMEITLTVDSDNARRARLWAASAAGKALLTEVQSHAA